MLAQFTDDEVALFEEARNGVLTRHIELTDESAESREQAAVRAKAQREKTLAELQSEREKLDVGLAAAAASLSALVALVALPVLLTILAHEP